MKPNVVLLDMELVRFCAVARRPNPHKAAKAREKSKNCGTVVEILVVLRPKLILPQWLQYKEWLRARSDFFGQGASGAS